MTGREKKIVHYLSENKIDCLLLEIDDERVSCLLTFVKRLYKGATLVNAANDVGMSSGTGSYWTKRWNEEGLGQLTPNFGDGRPPKLGDQQREELLGLLREGQPWMPCFALR